MQPKTLVLMFVAVVCGLASNHLTRRIAFESPDPQPATVETVKILVARKNLGLGILIKNPEDLFEERQCPKGEEPEKAVRDFERLRDQRLTKPLAAGQFVLPQYLVDKSAGHCLSSITVPKGRRAFTVKVPPKAVHGGFVLPDSRVDVTWVGRGENGPQQRLLLRNVRVLLVETCTGPPSGRPTVPSPITLSVTHEQAELLSLAIEKGSLELNVLPQVDEGPAAAAPVRP